MHDQRSRLVVGLVIIATFVVACNGGVTDEGHSNPMENILSTPGPPQPLELDLDMPDEVAEGESVPMTMVLRNTGNAPVKVIVSANGHSGPPSQLPYNYNIFVLADEHIVRQRRTGAYVQLPSPPQTLMANETLEYAWTWDQRDQGGDSVGSGTYQVIGTIEASVIGSDAPGFARSEPASVAIR